MAHPVPIVVRPGPARLAPCVHLGPRTGETLPCPAPSRCRAVVYQCAAYGRCLLQRPHPDTHAWCHYGCPAYTPLIGGVLWVTWTHPVAS